MEIPAPLLERASRWGELPRPERAELGRSLRRIGLSHGEICKVIPVPRGTLSYWLRDIQLDPQQVEAIKDRTFRRTGIPRDTQWKRREEVAGIRDQALDQAAVLWKQPLWCTGLALYWGEGAKTSHRLAMSNSDPKLLRVYIDWVRRYHSPTAEFVLAMHLHEGNDDELARAFWRDALDLPDAPFHKTFIKPKGTGHRKNTLPYGVCRVVVRRSTDAWIRTMSWIEAISNSPPYR